MFTVSVSIQVACVMVKDPLILKIFASFLQKQEIVTTFSQGMKGTVVANPNVVLPKG